MMVTLDEYRALAADARTALRMIREVVEQHAPPGSVPAEENVGQPLVNKAEVPVRGPGGRHSQGRRLKGLRSRPIASRQASTNPQFSVCTDWSCYFDRQTSSEWDSAVGGQHAHTPRHR